MKEHRIERNTKGNPFDTCERCKYLKDCNRRTDDGYSVTIRCSEFKIAKA